MGRRPQVRYLIDTHVLLWLLGAPDRIPGRVVSTLAARESELLVSAVSAMEVATKTRLGRLPGGRPLVDAWDARVEEIDAAPLPLTAAHAVLAGSMGWTHRDPFDRMLLAQATIENLVLVTVDEQLTAVPGLRVLTW